MIHYFLPEIGYDISDSSFLSEIGYGISDSFFFARSWLWLELDFIYCPPPPPTYNNVNCNKIVIVLYHNFNNYKKIFSISKCDFLYVLQIDGETFEL